MSYLKSIFVRVVFGAERSLKIGACRAGSEPKNIGSIVKRFVADLVWQTKDMIERYKRSREPKQCRK